jgi:hypothetical protein
MIRFLENVGSDAALRHIDVSLLQATMRDLPAAARSALLARDRLEIDALIQTPHKIYCALLTPKPAPKKAPSRKKPAPKKAPARKKPAPAKKPSKKK